MEPSSLDIIGATHKVLLHSALKCRNLPGHKSREDGNQTKIQRGAGRLQCHEEVFHSLGKGFGAATVVRRVCGRRRGIECRSALELSMPILRFQVANCFDFPCICWIQFNWRIITAATPQTLDRTYRKLLQTDWKMRARTCRLCRHEEASKSSTGTG